jgi:hypothetical protein
MSPRTQCPSCSSENQRKFNGELALHFPGLKGLNKPIVWAFPQILLCLDCGFAMFTLQGDTLTKARQTYTEDELITTPSDLRVEGV